MIRTSRVSVALSALLLAGFGASASAQTVISHESDYAFDGVSALYDAFDTYSSPTAVAFAPAVTILGDPTSFAWVGDGALSVANVATAGNTGTANLALTGTGSLLSPLVGNSHYSYASDAGQGLFTTKTIGGVETLSLASAPADFAGSNTSYLLNVTLLGNWTTDGTGTQRIDTASFGLASNFTVTNYFTYDSTLGATFFSARANGNVIGSFVPEPGNVAMLLGMTFSGAAFVLRRRRK